MLRLNKINLSFALIVLNIFVTNASALEIISNETKNMNKLLDKENISSKYVLGTGDVFYIEFIGLRNGTKFQISITIKQKLVGTKVQSSMFPIIVLIVILKRGMVISRQ